MRMCVITAHAGAPCIGDALLSWGIMPCVFVEDGRAGILTAYQLGFRDSQDIDILAHFHDDLIIRESDWAERVFAEFKDPDVGLVGFGGALEHGSRDIYKAPYDYHQLGRSYFLSNMDDAEVHGKRFVGSCDVAVLDGFSLIFRRQLLEKAGGWPVNQLGYVGYDYWACCMAHRLGYKIRFVGVRCHHLGGQTFVKLGIGQGPEHWQQFLAAHEYIYNEFPDVLPFVVKT